MRREPHTFRPDDLVGGDPALDLVNTVTGRNAGDPRDWLADYAAVVDWSRKAALVTARDATQLAALARTPAAAEAALDRLGALREALWSTFDPLARGRAPKRAALASIDEARRAAAVAGRLVADGAGARTAWTVERSGLDLVAHLVTDRAVALLADPPAGRLRVCDGDDCGWLFVDSSKSGRRRWCDMATCGNVAKARRHYERHG
jgi:predicted RNA-binding Zn ribbon-like protein